MKVTARLRSLQLYAELARAGVIGDESVVNRVVIDAPRGGLVTIHVESITDDKVLRVAPLLDRLPLDPDPEER